MNSPFLGGLIYKTRSTIPLRFRKVNKKKPAAKVDHAEELKKRQKLQEKFNAYKKLIYDSDHTKIQRSPEERAEAAKMVSSRSSRLLHENLEYHRKSCFLLKLKGLAYEQLPTQGLKDAAMIEVFDDFPENLGYVYEKPPKLSENIFGPKDFVRRDF